MEEGNQKEKSERMVTDKERPRWGEGWNAVYDGQRNQPSAHGPEQD